MIKDIADTDVFVEFREYLIIVHFNVPESSQAIDVILQKVQKFKTKSNAILTLKTFLQSSNSLRA